MSRFHIHADSFHWITGAADDPQDLCLHGTVTVTIGNQSWKEDGTVSATALYLLKSLTEEHVAGSGLQMIPCCGHAIYPNSTLTEVQIVGCNTGLDWSIFHKNGEIRLIAPDGAETTVPMAEYRAEVLRFADAVEEIYQKSAPKTPEDDALIRNGYIAFWNEWHRRYRDAKNND